MNLDFLFAGEAIALVGKIGILTLIVLYAIFSLIVFLQVRGLNKLITFGNSPIARIITTAFLVHLLLVISLFFLALAIL